MQKKDNGNKSLSGAVTEITFIRRGRWLAGALLVTALLFTLTVAEGCSNETAGLTETDDFGMEDTGGKMEIAETYYDFGSVPVGKMVERSFTIKNTGSGPLRLGEVDIKRLEGC